MLTVSACAWALPQRPHAALQRIRSAGFAWVDVRPDCWAGLRVAEDVTIHGLRVACAGLGPMTMAPGASLDLLTTPDLGRVVPYLAGALERGSRLGAKRAYVTSPSVRVDETRAYERAMARLADIAADLGVRLCVEPSPGHALGTAAEALRFVETVGHDNLYTLLDLGHCLLTDEDPALAVRQAGGRIGYVHIDDNDGRADRHWPLFQGTLTPAALDSTLDALLATGYDGPVAIELGKGLARPVAGLVEARDILLAWESSRKGAEPQDPSSGSVPSM